MRPLGYGSAGCKVRLNDELTGIIKPFIVIVRLCNASSQEATGYHWRAHPVFSNVDSFLVSDKRLIITVLGLSHC